MTRLLILAVTRFVSAAISAGFAAAAGAGERASGDGAAGPSSLHLGTHRDDRLGVSVRRAFFDSAFNVKSGDDLKSLVL